MGRCAVLLVLVAPCVLVSCRPPPARLGEFDSPDPASKLYAICRAGERRNRSAVPKLVEQLDSSDTAVRMFAITALERITGTRHGYSPYASLTGRQAAIDRWVEEGTKALRHEGTK